jgi:putative heme iron utilization protein
MTDGNFNAAREAKRLIRVARRGALATKDAESGAPYASLVAVAAAADGAPLLLLSGLARHTKNLAAEQRVALLVEDVDLADPLSGPRVTISGVIAPTADPEARRRYLARHPSAESFAGFGDFNFYRIEPEVGHLVAGFGRISTLGRADIVTDVSDAAELLTAEEGAVAHMNSDHADALGLYATKLLGAPEADWRCDGLDPEGVELSANGRALYLRFPERVRGPGPLRQVLKQLADQARSA